MWPLILVFFEMNVARKIATWIVALAPLIRIGTYFALPAFREKLTFFFLSSRADALMIGCLLALCSSEPQFASLLARANRAWVPLVCAGFIFCGVAGAVFGVSL